MECSLVIGVTATPQSTYIYIYMIHLSTHHLWAKGCYLSIWTLSIGGDVNIRRYQFGVSSWNIELSRILCRAFAHLLASAQLHLIWTCSITHLAYWVQCALTTPSSLSDCLVRPAITIFRAHGIKMFKAQTRQTRSIPTLLYMPGRAKASPAVQTHAAWRIIETNVTNESTNRVRNPRLYIEVCTVLNTSSRVFAQRSANSYWQLRQGKGGATDNLRQHEVEPWPSTASPRPYSGKSHKKNLLGPLETLQTLLFQAGAFSKSAPKGKQLHVRR